MGLHNLATQFWKRWSRGDRRPGVPGKPTRETPSYSETPDIDKYIWRVIGGVLLALLNLGYSLVKTIGGGMPWWGAALGGGSLLGAIGAAIVTYKNIDEISTKGPLKFVVWEPAEVASQLSLLVNGILTVFLLLLSKNAPF